MADKTRTLSWSGMLCRSTFHSLYCLFVLVCSFSMVLPSYPVHPACAASVSTSDDNLDLSGSAAPDNDGTPTTTGESTLNLPALIPQSQASWLREGEDEIYDQRSIFKYMNGAGEVYLSFAFQQLCVRRFSGEQEAMISVELYDMGNSADAFGIFGRNLTGAEVGIGQGSEYRAGYLNFWQDRYFVTVYADRESESTREGVLALGQQIAASISRTGALPDLLQILPAAGLLERSSHYFHRHTDLNHHYFLADENILLLNADTEAVMASYREVDYPSFLLIVKYPSAADAAEAGARYREHFLDLSEAKGDQAVELEDGTWTTAARVGRYFLAVYDAPSEKRALDLMAATLTRLPAQPD